MSDERSWPRVCIELPAVSADAAYAVLLSLGSIGSFEQEGAPKGQVRIAAYFSPGAMTPAALRQAVEAAFARDPALASAALDFGEEAGSDWSRGFRQHFAPFALLPGIVVVPSWETYQPKPHETVISMDPGMAFGTGKHETTQLCAEALASARERCGARTPSLLDVGSGSGILAILGRLLGIERILAVENDPTALAVAEGNIRKNGCERIELAPSLDGVDRRFDIVVANILLSTLLELRPSIVRILAPDGTLILCGITHDQEQALVDAYAPSCHLAHVTRRGEWSCLTLTRRGDA
jgi:ribosomal protein L11 methyltransferase